MKKNYFIFIGLLLLLSGCLNTTTNTNPQSNVNVVSTGGNGNGYCGFLEINKISAAGDTVVLGSQIPAEASFISAQIISGNTTDLLIVGNGIKISDLASLKLYKAKIEVLTSAGVYLADVNLLVLYDFNHDGLITWADFTAFRLLLGNNCPEGLPYCPGDIDGDGAVAASDLILLSPHIEEYCDANPSQCVL